MKKIPFLGFILAAAIVGGCSAGSNAQQKANDKVDSSAQSRSAYIPHNSVEFNNYNNAQKLYDDPSTIIFCTTTWGNASAPLVTVPIAGKLTSSTTSYFPPESVDDQDNWGVLVPNRSVDGMYHPNPPQYRYGFTPGGQYIDFFNMPTFCTTALTKFQRQATRVSLALDPASAQAQQVAQAALKRGDKAGAQRALEQALGQ